MKINSIKPPSPSPTGYVYIPVDKKQLKDLTLATKIVVHLEGTVAKLAILEDRGDVCLEAVKVKILPDDEENEYTKMAEDDE